MATTLNYPKAVSPKGVAIYPRLNTPDDKYKAGGQYKVKLALDDSPELDALRAKVDALLDEKYDETVAEITATLTAQKKPGLIAKAVAAVEKTSPFVPEEDGETGDETGRILINAKMTASGVGKKGPWSRKPGIFSASGAPLKNPPMIGSGSTLKLSLELFPYYAPNDKKVGVSFRLEAVQIITLVQGGQRDASGYGFGAEDGDDIEDGELSAAGGFGSGVDDGEDDL